MHTILLTKYEMRIQRRRNIYIYEFPPKLTQILHFIIIMHDIALLYWRRWYYKPRVNDPNSDITKRVFREIILRQSKGYV